MPAHIDQERLSTAARVLRSLSSDDAKRKVVSGLLRVNPDRELHDARTTASRIMFGGWPAKLLECSQEETDAILEALSV